MVALDATIDPRALAAEAQRLIGAPVAVATGRAYLADLQAHGAVFILQAPKGHEAAVQALVSGATAMRANGRQLQVLAFTSTEELVRPAPSGHDARREAHAAALERQVGAPPSSGTSRRSWKRARRPTSLWATRAASPCERWASPRGRVCRRSGSATSTATRVWGSWCTCSGTAGPATSPRSSGAWR